MEVAMDDIILNNNWNASDFTSWLRKVDVHMVSTFGLAHDDLPDALWRDKYDDGLSPIEAIESTIEDEWADMPEMGDLWHG